MAFTTDGKTGVAWGGGCCCCCVPNVVDMGWLDVDVDPKLNPLAGVLGVDPKADDVVLSDGTVVAACPKKNVFPKGAVGAAVVTVTFDDPKDSVVAAGLI